MTNKKPNRLINEKSPYLLQHAYNPVDWYPWTPEAFKRASDENIPIFLSIGYSTCHWCHVMEKESFSDIMVANLLNEHFISIKVDREERPDIDQIYMKYCQEIQGHGGWPLSIFMTPEAKPFFGGTYYPKTNKYGIEGFSSILIRINKGWKNYNKQFRQQSNKIVDTLKNNHNIKHSSLSEMDLINTTFLNLLNNFDEKYGGFSPAPKFPMPHKLYFLMNYGRNYKNSQAIEAAEKTLISTYQGGIFDHIGFGFSRYTTDNKWLVPHFEKMLYDNALLAIAYIEAYSITKKDIYANITDKIFTYVLRNLKGSLGGFYSAEDADSEGIEGKFYLWTKSEIIDLLGRESGEKFCKHFNITEGGNFANYNIPNLIDTSLNDLEIEFIEKSRQILFDYRKKRIHPFKDDKILTSWNALMISALSIGGRILDNPKFIDEAENSFNFIITKLVDKNGRLLARFRDNESGILGYLDDYANIIWAMIELYESTFKVKYLKLAFDYTDKMIQLFWDFDNGGFFTTGNDSETLILRPKEFFDGALPSGNSVAYMNLIKLSRLTKISKFANLSTELSNIFKNYIYNEPTSFCYYLNSLINANSPPKDIIISAGNDIEGTNKMLKIIRSIQDPFINVLIYNNNYLDLDDLIPQIKQYPPINNLATAYICHDFSCQSPINNIEQFAESIRSLY